MPVTSVVNVTITAIKGANFTCTLSMANQTDPYAQIMNDATGYPTLIEVIAAKNIAVQISFSLLTTSFPAGGKPAYTGIKILGITISPRTVVATTNPIGLLDSNSRDPGIPYTYTMNFQATSNGKQGSYVWDPGVVNENIPNPPL